MPLKVDEMTLSGASAPLGVTVAICTYNGAERLPATLNHLWGQVAAPEVPWEVIVIDNASTDNSAGVTRAHWSSEAPVPLRIVREERLGLSYARERAFAEAEFPIVLFVDDDNWLSPNWVKTVSKIMTTRPEVGACGGLVEPVFETPAAPWVAQFTKWPPDDGCAHGDVTDRIGWLMGAGLSVRTSAYRQLCDAGFYHLAVDRQGKALTVGGDTEICFALRMAGWRLWLDSSLTMKHFMPARRLTWSYLCASMHGIGFSDPALDAYKFVLEGVSSRNSELFPKWSSQVVGVLRCIAKNLALRPQKVIARSSPRYEGDQDVLRIFGYLGRLEGLLNCRSNYSLNYQVVYRFAKRLSDTAGDSALRYGCDTPGSPLSATRAR